MDDGQAASGRNIVLNTHANLLEALEQDALPDTVRSRFVRWCVLEQARPALVALLSVTTLAGAAAAIEQASDLSTLAQLVKAIKSRADELAGHGKAGTAAAAALFEFDNLLRASREPGPDASACAFFAARVCGWQALVHNERHHPARKREAEHNARRDQETVLSRLLDGYSPYSY
jgi:hypothetical protein